MLKGALPFAKDVNKQIVNFLFKNSVGAIITDIWGERVKHVKHGPRNNDKAAYLNIKRHT